jgi:HTH-type transcriptional regulator / antitoxin HigA
MIRKSRYMQLIEVFPLRPIRSEEELGRAARIAGRLAVASKRDRDEQDYLDVLADLIEQYETQHHPIESSSAPELLAFLLEENSLSQAQLARETDIAKSTLSAVLTGRRSFSLSHVRALCRRFKLDSNLFLTAAGRPPTTRKKAR